MPIKITPKHTVDQTVEKKLDEKTVDKQVGKVKNKAVKISIVRKEEPKVEPKIVEPEVEEPKVEVETNSPPPPPPPPKPRPKPLISIQIKKGPPLIEKEDLPEEEPIEVEEEQSKISIVAHKKPIVSTHHQSIQAATMEDLLEDLTAKWNEFSDKPRAKVCRWIVEPQEAAFMEQFLIAENSTEKKTKDFFFKFETDFEDPISYPEALIKELKEQIKNNLELDGRVAYAYWDEWRALSVIQGPEYFTNNLLRFFETVIKDPESRVVAYFCPKKVADYDQWMHYFGRTIELKLDKRICLMLTDTKDKPIQEDLVLAFPIRLFTIHANLNVEGYLKGLNNVEGDLPPDEFRDLLTQLIQTPANDSTTIAKLEDRLVEITEDKGWPHLRICVHNIVGQKLLEINYNEAAYKKHIQSREIAASIEDYEKRGALAEGLTAESLKTLLPDAIFAQAMACFETKEYELAALHFTEAANHHRFAENYLPEILSRKMGGLCYQKAERPDQAWDIYNHALDAGEFLTDEQRKDSPLAEIGNELIELTEPLELTSSRVLIRQRMIELLGGDWEDLLEDDEENTDEK